jgi:hypothetical protein
MIFYTTQRLLDAGVCEQGRVDSLAAMERDGLTLDTPVSAVWGMGVGGVPGTLWGMCAVLPQYRGGAIDVLWQFVLVTATRHAGATYPQPLQLLRNLALGHLQNLVPAREKLRIAALDEADGPQGRAIALMLYQAMDDAVLLNIRATQVAEQAMLAATHHETNLISDSTQRYKAEYRMQFKQFCAILNGESPT